AHEDVGDRADDNQRRRCRVVCAIDEMIAVAEGAEAKDGERMVSRREVLDGCPVRAERIARYRPCIHPAAPVRVRVDQDRDVVHVSRSEEHTSELQSPYDLVCRLLLEKKKKKKQQLTSSHSR